MTSLRARFLLLWSAMHRRREPWVLAGKPGSELFCSSVPGLQQGFCSRGRRHVSLWNAFSVPACLQTDNMCLASDGQEPGRGEDLDSPPPDGRAGRAPCRFRDPSQALKGNGYTCDCFSWDKVLRILLLVAGRRSSRRSSTGWSSRRCWPPR